MLSGSTSAKAEHWFNWHRVSIYQHFTGSFYESRSQKCKKDWQLNCIFCSFGILWVKALCKMFVKPTPALVDGVGDVWVLKNIIILLLERTLQWKWYLLTHFLVKWSLKNYLDHYVTMICDTKTVFQMGPFTKGLSRTQFLSSHLVMIIKRLERETGKMSIS